MDLTIENLYRGNLDWLPARTIFLTRAGSHAYGLATPESDLDLRGLCIPPLEYFAGFLRKFEQAESHGAVDLTVFGLVKFFALAADCNPNIIELLFTDPSDWLLRSPVFDALVEHRQWFLSQKARQTFSGYAMAQLRRIKTHRKWLLDPPEKKPERADFGLPARTVLPADELGAIDAIRARDPGHEFPEHVMVIYERERAYGNAMREFQQHEIWKKRRNPARAALEEKHGYDCKHAMHLVRLMRMCREILVDGAVRVKRPDREELLAIRDGAWSYDALLEWAERQDEDMRTLAAASPLPQAADRDRLDALCCDMVAWSIARVELAAAPYAFGDGRRLLGGGGVAPC